jgi:hypothetical protein
MKFALLEFTLELGEIALRMENRKEIAFLVLDNV